MLNNSGKKSALLIVSTPLHLLYAVECIREFHIDCVDLVVLVKRLTDRPQLESMIKLFSWRNIEWCLVNSRLENRYITLRELHLSTKLEFCARNYDYGIYADYGQTILANSNCEDCIFLGDGTKILYESFRSEYGGSREDRLSGLDRAVRRFLRRRIVLEKKPLVYSPFYVRADRYQQNKFESLRRIYSDGVKCRGVRKDLVYFFGAYYCEVDSEFLMNNEEYIDIFKKVCRYYKELNKRIIYVPHRHESEGKLKRLSETTGVEVEIFDYPAEYQLALVDELPIEVASFSSSCLFHFKALDVFESVKCFYIDFSHYTDDHQKYDVFYQALMKCLGEKSVVDVSLLCVDGE